MKQKKPHPIHRFGSTTMLALMAAVSLQTAAFTYLGTPMRADVAGFWNFMSQWKSGQPVDLETAGREMPPPPSKNKMKPSSVGSEQGSCLAGQFCLAGEQFACPSGQALITESAPCVNQSGRPGQCYSCGSSLPPAPEPESVAVRCNGAVSADGVPFVGCMADTGTSWTDWQICAPGTEPYQSSQPTLCLTVQQQPGHCVYCRNRPGTPLPSVNTQCSALGHYGCSLQFDAAGNPAPGTPPQCPDGYSVSIAADKCQNDSGSFGPCYDCLPQDAGTVPVASECDAAFLSVVSGMSVEARAALAHPAGATVGMLLKVLAQFPDAMTLDEVRNGMQACGYGL